MTRVRMRDALEKVQHWSADVRYDDWGQPYAVGKGAFAELFGWPYKACDDIILNQGGGTQAHLVQWKHESGPPVDFSRIDRSWK